MKSLLIFLFIFSFGINADEYLIQEMESLKSSLEKNDPDRVELSLRLADLYFDVSIQEGSGDEIITQREKAFKLYEDVLFGRDGLKKASGEKAVKIKYQLARVAGKLNKIGISKKYYHQVFADSLVPNKMKRQSALALAEYYEEDVNFNQSDKYYTHAIELCESVETCNYAHYKRAWLLYKEVRLEEAIGELKKSLWDSKKQAREKVINDLLLFFSAAQTDGMSELAYIDELAKKAGQPDLVRKLVEAFYAAGNRVAGSNVLVEWNKKNPSLFYEARLLEEFYGFRNMPKTREYLGAIEKRNSNELPQNKEEAKELNAMIKRVIVQLDSDADQDAKFSPELMRIIDIYLGFYPNDDMRKKLQQGWLKAQTDTKKEIAKLKIWIKEDISFEIDKKEVRKLRQTRLSLAQKEKMSDVVLEESLALSKLLKGEEAREFRYVYAHENYKNKNYDVALPIFKELALVKEGTPDKWGIRSQNLALDIYNAKKDFASLAAQAALWITNAQIAADPKLKNEIKEMSLAKIQADFEHTATLGESKEALERFYNYCFDKVFEEKSCANAKVLAVKLKDQTKLVALLEKAKDEKALMVEYELMGRFSEAARLQEKFNLNRSSGIETYFKIALLYEIDQNFKQRDRILKKLIAKVKRDKKIDPKWEGALYLTLNEAGMINNKTLMLNWSLAKKLQIANRLEGDKSNKTSKKILTSGLTYTGPHWAKYVLKKIQKLDQRQAKTSFYGRRSQVLFKRRVRRIEALNKEVVKYLEGADIESRIYLLDIAKKAYLGLATEILSTPLPEGLTEDVMMQVQAQLSQMATPYSKVSEDYARLQNEQLATLTPEEKLAYEAKLEDFDLDYVSFIKVDKTEQTRDLASLDFTDFKTSKADLALKPDSLETLMKLENFYKKNNAPRMAAYFTGRINSLKEQND